MSRQDDNNPPEPRSVAARLLAAAASVRLTVVVVSVMAAGILVGTILYGRFGPEPAVRYVYAHPWFLVAVAVLAINLLACTQRRRYLHRRRWGLLLMHLGLVLILVGGALSGAFAQRGTVKLFDGDHVKEAANKAGGAPLRFGFTLALDRFDVETHPPREVVVAEAPRLRSRVEITAREGERAALPRTRYTVVVDRLAAHFGFSRQLVADGNGHACAELLLRKGDGKARVILSERTQPRVSTLDGAFTISLRRAESDEAFRRVIKEYGEKPGSRPVESKAGEPTLVIFHEGGEARVAATPGALWVDSRTGMRVKVVRAVADFRIERDGTVFSASGQPKNPAIRIEITGESKTTTRWLFARTPGFSHGGGERGGARFRYVHPVVAVQSLAVHLLAGSDDRLVCLVDRVGKGREVLETTPGEWVEIKDSPYAFLLTQYMAKARISERAGETGSDGGGPAVHVIVTGPAATEERWLVRSHSHPIGCLKGEVRLAYRRFPGSVKRYVSEVHVVEDAAARAEIAVNHPFKHGGWRFSQASYGLDEDSDRLFTVLSVVRDPGVPVVYGGFILLGLGMLVLYVVRPLRRWRREASSQSP